MLLAAGADIEACNIVSLPIVDETAAAPRKMYKSNLILLYRPRHDLFTKNKYLVARGDCPFHICI